MKSRGFLRYCSFPIASTAVLCVAWSGIAIAAQPAASGQPIVLPAAPPAAPSQITTEQLLRNLYCMEQRVKQLEQMIPQKVAAIPAPTPGAPAADGAPPIIINAPVVLTDAPAGAPNAGAPPAFPAPLAAPAPNGRTAKKVTTTTVAKAPADPCAPPTEAAAAKELFALPTPAPAPAPGVPGPQPGGDVFAITPIGGAAPAAGAGNKPILGLLPSPVEGLQIGAYGEMKYGRQRNPAANGQWQNGFDAHRFVLLPTYQITKNIIFNAEIEFEHAGSGFDADDKLHGTAEVEQMFIDFKIIDQFNFRAPGIDLVPFGYINLYHEPTNFYSVHRPALTNGLIPTTWAPPATSIWGTLVEGLKYQFQISSALEDFGDDYGRRTDANTVPDGGYTGGFDGKGALGFGKPPRGDFRQLSSDMGYTLRVAYEPTFLPGFAGSTSIYYTANTTPRGAYAQLDNTMRLGRSSLAMFDTEFRYKIPKSKFELRGEYVEVRFGNPANLRANNDGDDSNNIGKKMYGYSGEIAYHVPLGVILASEWEAVPFYRYTHQNLQTKGFAGTDANLPTGAGQIDSHTAGVAVFPSPKMVMKLDYTRTNTREVGGVKVEQILGALGFHF